jgi:hypothetical protein
MLRLEFTLSESECAQHERPESAIVNDCEFILTSNHGKKLIDPLKLIEYSMSAVSLSEVEGYMINRAFVGFRNASTLRSITKN